MRLFLLISLLLTSVCTAFAKPVKTDSSAVQLRSFNYERLNNFRNDKDFQYIETKEPPASLWQRFWNWIWYKIGQFLSTRSGKNTAWATGIIIGVAVIVFFVMKVMGMNRTTLFSRKGAGGLSYSISSDDIHNISFDEAIKNAIETGNLRMAVRMLYLQSLKLLSDKGYIQWQINKTNSDYFNEVTSNNWSSIFKTLTYKFEYTWYGETNLNQDEFEKLYIQFQQFNNQL